MATKKAAPKKRATKRATPKRASEKRTYRKRAPRIDPDNRPFENLLDEHGSHFRCAMRGGAWYTGRISVKGRSVYLCTPLMGGDQNISVNNMGQRYTLYVGDGSRNRMEIYNNITQFSLGRKDTTLPRVTYAAGYVVSPTSRGWSFGCGAVKASVTEVRRLLAVKEQQAKIAKEIEEVDEEIRKLQQKRVEVLHKRDREAAIVRRLINSASRAASVDVRQADVEYLKALLATR